MLNLTDSHCHLNHADFGDDADAVVQRALDAGVSRLVTIGTRLEDTAELIALTRKYPQVFATVGVHPEYVAERDVSADEIAERDTIDALTEFPDVTGVLHCFSSNAELAKFGLEQGWYLSASGILTFKKAQELRGIFADVPLNRLLVETDAPYLAPVPYRGKRNEPSFVVKTAEMLAEIKGVSLEELAKITTENFLTLFTKAY